MKAEIYKEDDLPDNILEDLSEEVDVEDFDYILVLDEYIEPSELYLIFRRIDNDDFAEVVKFKDKKEKKERWAYIIHH